MKKNDFLLIGTHFTHRSFCDGLSSIKRKTLAWEKQ